ncbi:methyltransferase domain-containing protein [Candidatus Parcubacteria bacterium]|nr:MAG: methyltransferase domain-containing protein [Candidatus Parcubacteria bacterium]
MKYIFVLGQASNLAKQEVLNILAKDSKKNSIIGQNFILAESEKTASQLIKTLGGTVKIALFLDIIENLDQLQLSTWQKYLEKNLSLTKKNFFGFSLYHGSNKEYQKISQLAFELKKTLKEKYKLRFVSSKKHELSSVIVSKNNLLGNELIIIKDQNHGTEEYFLGLTQSVQDFSAYGKRDMDRPERDSRSGMLPPKLAQMMLNLASTERNKTVLDPFCGSGTIIQEAFLLGYKKIYGSDREQKAVTDSQKNIEWLRKNFSGQAQVEIKKINVQNLSQHFKDKKIDLIVTEPYMGDARFVVRQHKIKQLEQLKSDLQKLYYESFSQFKKILQPQGRVVFIFPIFNAEGERLYTLDENIISALGFEKIKPDVKSDNLSIHDNIIYSRPGQKVEREISIWQNKL